MRYAVGLCSAAACRPARAATPAARPLGHWSNLAYKLDPPAPHHLGQQQLRRRTRLVQPLRLKMLARPGEQTADGQGAVVRRRVERRALRSQAQGCFVSNNLCWQSDAKSHVLRLNSISYRSKRLPGQQSGTASWTAIAKGTEI